MYALKFHLDFSRLVIVIVAFVLIRPHMASYIVPTAGKEALSPGCLSCAQHACAVRTEISLRQDMAGYVD